jgi:aryl-alcohol dehydrogenase-like predicted oxidoreductase
MAQVGLAWILSKDVVSAPLIGTTSLDNLKDIIGSFAWEFDRRILMLNHFSAGVHVKLTEEEIKSLEEPYKPQSISGHW